MSLQPQQGLIPVSEALERILAQATPLQHTETVPLQNALNRVLAEDILSTLAVPPADNSAVDGYGFCLADIAASSDTLLPISQRITAGQAPNPLAKGTAVRIFTGAEVPAGVDTVIMQEDAQLNGQQLQLSAAQLTALQTGSNIRKQGQDIQPGDLLVATGTVLQPAMLGLIASVGTASVTVFKPLRVAIFSTGDELVTPGQPLPPGQIYNSNRYTLTALLQQAGAEVIDLGQVEDTLEATQSALQEAANRADCIITTGGVSVGEEDHIRPAVESLGTLNVWRIAIKPGKPLAFGDVQGTPFFGLPGNPVAVFITFTVFVRAYFRSMHQQGTHLPTRTAIAAFSTRPGKRQEYLRVRLAANGTVEAHPNQSSGVLSSVVWADALAIIPPGIAVNAGDSVEIILLDTLH